MALDRLKKMIVGIREAVEKVQAALDDRPLLQAALDELRGRVAEAETEAEATPEA